MASAEGGRGVASAPQVQGAARGAGTGGGGEPAVERGLGRSPGPAGGGDPPSGGGSVRVVVLGQPGDLQEVAETGPSMPCSSGGTEDTGRHPRGGGRHQGTTRGSSGQ